MKPIIFSTQMVQAILDGKKTQTRRVIKPQPSSGVRKSVFVKSGIEDGHGREIKPKYQPGDILWVRETWCERLGVVDKGLYIYKAHVEPQDEIHQYALDQNKWRPSIFMPREAARIFLLVTNVRVERLQEITEKDALAEGVKNSQVYWDIFHSRGWSGLANNNICSCAFAALWDSINKKRGYGWDTNPWVWVIEFEKISNAETLFLYRKED